ncbi:MAG TPA: hypothetical protein VFW53_11320 [Gallionella sp.]|nr:hypothetical protein [Gallionella sp.]
MSNSSNRTRQPGQQVPNCLECVHYYITWDSSFPYGCRAMDFKAKRLPQWDVLESSGKPCLMFKLRTTK